MDDTSLSTVGRFVLTGRFQLGLLLLLALFACLPITVTAEAFDPDADQCRPGSAATDLRHDSHQHPKAVLSIPSAAVSGLKSAHSLPLFQNRL